jgi:hypothetical protein
MVETLHIYLDDASGAVATWGPVVFIVWRAYDSTAPMEAAELAVPDLVARYGEGRKLFYVHRAPGGAKFASNPKVREAAMAHFEKHDTRFVAAAVAIEAEGFVASIVRSLTAGVLLVRKTDVRSGSFQESRDAVRWLGPISQTMTPFDAEAMIRALEEALLCKPR